MSSWGLAFISLGCVFIILSQAGSNNTSLLVTGGSIIIVGIFMVLKAKNRGRK